MKTAILNNYLGHSPSQDELDNLDETKAVEAALKELKFDVQIVPFSFDLRKTISALKRINPAFIFNLVESIEGHDSLAHFAPAILDSLGIPYTGCSTGAMYASANKVTTKNLLQTNGISTPKWATLDELTAKRSPLERKRIIIKHLWEHASEDIDDSSVFYAGDKKMLREAILKRKKNLESYFAEEFIEGREFNVSLLEEKSGVRVLSPAEMTFVDYPKDKLRIVNYRAKWEEESFEYKHTVRTFDFEGKDRQLLSSLRAISKKVWNVFNLNGYARVDFRVDEKGNPYVLEINTNPCISPDSGFVAACIRDKIKYKEIISRIVENTCGK